VTTVSTDPNDVAPAVASLDTIVSLSKRRGFVFPSSEIYGGINAVWDYGPLGVELKNNVKRAWWRAMVQEREDMVGLDAGILMHPQVWITSGHVGSFSDPLVECGTCHRRYRLDKLPGAEASHAARHLDLDVAFEAVDRALVVDVVLRQVAARRQHEVEQLEAIGLQQARADRVGQGRPERANVDDVERLSVWQGHDVSPESPKEQARCPTPARVGPSIAGAYRHDLRGTR